MLRSLAAVALPAMSLVLLLGCGAEPGSDDDATMGRPAGSSDQQGDSAQEPPPAATGAPAPGAPATGVRIVGTDYAFNAPSGWHDITKQLRRNAQQVDSGAGEDRSEVTTVRENINVVVEPGSPMTLDAVEQAAPRQLSFMVDDLEILDRVQVDGAEAAHMGGEANTGESSFRLDQFVVLRGGTMYTVTFTVDDERSDADRQDLIDSVLATWEWPT